MEYSELTEQIIKYVYRIYNKNYLGQRENQWACLIWEKIKLRASVKSKNYYK